MTIASRRLARRCRERLVSDIFPASPAEPTTAEPPTTVEQTDDAGAPLENVDATT
jgi:hypothetical protein